MTSGSICAGPPSPPGTPSTQRRFPLLGQSSSPLTHRCVFAGVTPRAAPAKKPMIPSIPRLGGTPPPSPPPSRPTATAAGATSLTTAADSQIQQLGNQFVRSPADARRALELGAAGAGAGGAGALGAPGHGAARRWRLRPERRRLGRVQLPGRRAQVVLWQLPVRFARCDLREPRHLLCDRRRGQRGGARSACDLEPLPAQRRVLLRRR